MVKALLLGDKSYVITHQKLCFYFSITFDIDFKQNLAPNKNLIKMHTERYFFE